MAAELELELDSPEEVADVALVDCESDAGAEALAEVEAAVEDAPAAELEPELPAEPPSEGGSAAAPFVPGKPGIVRSGSRFLIMRLRAA